MHKGLSLGQSHRYFMVCAENKLENPFDLRTCVAKYKNTYTK